MIIRVVPYDSQWPARYEAEAKRLCDVIDEVVVRAHHIGSTAVPGLRAKPIIDVLLEVSTLPGLDACSPRLEALGYEAKGEWGIPGRRYFRLDNELGDRTHQVHAFDVNSRQADRHLAFRDYLVSHAEVAREYGELKQELAKRFPTDIYGYMDGKNAFVKHHEAEALAWRARRCTGALGDMNILRAGSLVLEPQITAHAAEMFTVLSDPAIYAFENSPPESLAWLERRFARLESRASTDGEEQWLNWVIRLPSGGLAGYVQATIARDRVAHIAYELGSAFWRQGIGSAAVSAVLVELAATYAVNTVAATLKSRNYRSAAFLRSLSFSEQLPRALSGIAHAPDELVMYKQLAVGLPIENTHRNGGRE